MAPITAVAVGASSLRKVPDLRVKFWILIKSGLVPTTGTEGRKVSSSPERELTETARGATEAILSSFSIVATSFKVKLDFKYIEEEVNSSTTRETAVLVVEGRTTTRSEPI